MTRVINAHQGILATHFFSTFGTDFIGLIWDSSKMNPIPMAHVRKGDANYINKNTTQMKKNWPRNVSWVKVRWISLVYLNERESYFLFPVHNFMGIIPCEKLHMEYRYQIKLGWKLTHQRLCNRTNDPWAFKLGQTDKPQFCSRNCVCHRLLNDLRPKLEFT